ncbi:MAG: GNAT family N-acetyltransferase [Oscillochloris sp.]|nr:GNAT family N-acetyltransferase [Oscillochloris sp.]
MDAYTAWNLFITGFTDTGYARRVGRCYRAGPLDAVRFAGDEDRPRAPFEEFFVWKCAPAEALAAIAAAQPLPEHYVTVFADRPGLPEVYAQAGYRLSHSEALMVRDLANPMLAPLHLPVTAIRSIAEANRANASDPQGIVWIVPDNLADPRMRHYVIMQEQRVVSRGRNFMIDADHSYVSRVFTADAQRGQGLAQAIMHRILAEDQARNARWSILTASVMGERMYERLGYVALGSIHIFEPALGS